MNIPKLIPFADKCLVCGKSHSNENEFIQCIDKHDKRKLTFKILNFIEKAFKFKFAYKTKYSSEIIERYESKIDWDNISKYQQLSGYIIEKYRNKLNWNYILSRHELSETTIAKCYDKIDWYLFIRYHNMCKEFIEKLLKQLGNTDSDSEPHITTFLCYIGCDVDFTLKRLDNIDLILILNKYNQNFKKHIMTILSENKIQLNEEFKNELLSMILREI